MRLDQVGSPNLSNYLLQVFGSLDVTEKKATCDDCYCSKASRGDLPYYDKNLKCCTFQPFLPNYVVGNLLSDPSVTESIKNNLRKKIQLREYALPMGIFVPVAYQVKFNSREPEDFGNRTDFLCPYFDHNKKNCGIWKNRGSVCASYYCVSDFGPSGLKFWEILGDFLHVCEMVLAQDCVVSMGLSPDGIDSQLEYINCETGTTEELSSNSMSEALFKTYWTEWDGNIEDYYLNCSKYVNQLGFKDMKELLGEETLELELQLKVQIKNSFV